MRTALKFIGGFGICLALPLIRVIVTGVIAPPSFGAIVDRAAVAVGAKVITDSEILRRIRLTSFQNGELPDFSLTSRREAVQRLIDLKLVEREMELGHYVHTPEGPAKELLDAFTAQHFRGSAEAVRLSLAAIGLTPADLQADFAEQADLLSFTSLRFRPAVEVSDREVEEYYRNHIASTPPPVAGASPPSLAEARASIEEILASQRADLELDAWLRDQRTRTRIVYLEKELDASPDTGKDTGKDMEKPPPGGAATQ